MRHRSAVALVAAGLLLGCAAIPAAAQGTSSQENAQPAPEKGDNPAGRQAADETNRKSSGTNDQAGPSNNGKASTEPNSQGEQATHSVSGRAGKQEPGAQAPTGDTPVFVNGALDVPGAPTDSQTVPAKFSKHNAALDGLPIMAMPLNLTAEQKRMIADSVKLGDKPVQSTSAKPAEELPWNVTVHDLGASANDPQLAKLKYVRTQDRILLVQPPNRIVVGEVKN
jgi:hypothetical protein